MQLQLSATHHTSSLRETESRLKSQRQLPIALVNLLRLIPPSSIYKSDQLEQARDAMLSLIELHDNNDDDEQQQLPPRLLYETITYYFQTLHAACHEILGHVYISLAHDVYNAVMSTKRKGDQRMQPQWCRWMYEILQTDLEVTDNELVAVLQDWMDCTLELDEIHVYLEQTRRLDLWECLSFREAANVENMLEPEARDNDSTMSSLKTDYIMINGETMNSDKDDRHEDVTNGSTEVSVSEHDVKPLSDPRELFRVLAGRVEAMMNQDRINSTLYFPTVYSAMEALQSIYSEATESELREGLWIASSALLRRDATWIFRLLDQRGLIQRDDIYQLIHVYCNEPRKALGIQHALSMMMYFESRHEKNAYIRRPDPIMYRMILSAIGETAAYGFGRRALQVMQNMAKRANADEDLSDESWKPVFSDHLAAVLAFVDDSKAWPSVSRADGLVRSLYHTDIGRREAPAIPLAIQDLIKVGAKLRIVSTGPHQSTAGPLYKVLESYNAEIDPSDDASNTHRRVQAAVSLFEFAVEQTAKGNGTLEELSKNHFFLVIESCKETNTFFAQECVRLFTRIDHLVEQGLLPRELVSPSVSYQILSLLAADKSPGHSSAAECILDHYVSHTKESRLAAFQFAINCCCAEDSALGCEKAVTLIELAARTFRRKPFRDSFFVEPLRQMDMHSPNLASRVFDVVNKKLYPVPLEVNSRITVLMSLYRSFRKDPSAGQRVHEVVTKLEKLRDWKPQHPAFVSGECLEVLESTTAEPVARVVQESSLTACAIDILLSSKQAGDIVMAESILEQGEIEETPHGPSTYQKIIEAFIGINDMSSATSVLRRMKKYHSRDFCIELEMNVFDILLSSGMTSDLQLAEYMMSWENHDRSDLANMCTKILYTYLTLPDGLDLARNVLKQLTGKLDATFLKRLRVVFVDPLQDESAEN